VVVATLAHVLGQSDNVAVAYDRGVRRLVDVAAAVAGSSGVAEPERTLVASMFVASMLGFGLQYALDPELDRRAGATIGHAFDHCAGGA
jgi:hypothetical protein